MKLFLSLIILIFTGIFFQQLYKKKLFIFQEVSSFPYLEAGHYIGNIDIGNIEIGSKKKWFYLESTVKPSLIFSFLKDDSNSLNIEKTIQWTMLNNEKLGSKLPISFNKEFYSVFCDKDFNICNKNSNFLLIASSNQDGGYEGFIKEEVEKKVIDKKIALIKFKEINIKKDKNEIELDHINSLLTESLTTNSELITNIKDLKNLKEEKIKFDNILFNKEEGFKKIKDQYEEEVLKLEELKSELKSLSLEEQNLKVKSNLMQKIQPYGKLVALSRESMDREVLLLEKLQVKKFNKVVEKKSEFSGVDLQDNIFNEKQKILELKRMKAEYENR